jgi:hypothetical protein
MKGCCNGVFITLVCSTGVGPMFQVSTYIQCIFYYKDIDDDETKNIYPYMNIIKNVF